MRDYRRISVNPLFKKWYGMQRRCCNPDNNDYGDYGGRGIYVCDRWLDFKAFVDDMGDSYREGLTIERRDNDDWYRPENCYWATMKEQCNNRSTTHKIENPKTGEIKSVTEWSIVSGISQKTIMSRIRLGYTDFEKLMAKRLPRWNERKLKNPETGEERNISAWSMHFGVDACVTRKRIESGIKDFKIIFSKQDLRILSGGSKKWRTGVLVESI